MSTFPTTPLPIPVTQSPIQQTLKRICNGIIRQLGGFNELNCYPAPHPVYVSGQDERVIQVCYNHSDNDTSPDGGQQSGNVQMRNHFTLALWYRLNLDPHDMSAEQLTREAEGLIDYVETVRKLFEFTYLGNQNDVTLEPVRWDGTGKPEPWEMEDGQGVMLVLMEVSTSLRFELPRTQTLLPADVM